MSAAPQPKSPPRNHQRLPIQRRLAKLQAMSWAELSHRATYAAFCAWESIQHRRGAYVRPDRLPRGLDAELTRAPDWQRALLDSRTASRRRFPTSFLEATQATSAFTTRWHRNGRRAIDEANAVLGGKVPFFGRTFACSPGTDWQADPVTGRRWPAVYHRRVPSGRGDVGYGDIKHVWELNRHQFFVDLARAHVVTGERRYVSYLSELLHSWHRQNPYGTGVNWSCALEPAFRAMSWAWSYGLTCDALDDAAHLLWLEAFLDHGRFLYRHLEYFSSPYNHLAGEACALYLLGALFPEFAESPRWRARGRFVLESTAHAQFHADGGTVEQSTFYHHATTGFYLLAQLQALRIGEAFSPSTLDVLERALEFSMHLQQPDGRQPAIGGADDGKPIRFEHLPFWDFRPYLAIGAVLFDRSDFKTASGGFGEDAYWLLGSDGEKRFEAVTARPPVASVALRESGYVVLRVSGDQPEPSDYLCFDCGPQAAGLRRDDVPSAAHGHADCLSLVLWLGGQPLLVDSGFFCYNGAPNWEVHFRKTLAHNTVTVDGRDQAQHVSKMAWCRTYRPHLSGWGDGDHGAWVSGGHDGFARLSSPAWHDRTVHLNRNGFAIVLDRLRGDGTHRIDAHYHLASSAARLEPPAGAVVDERATLHWAASTPLSPTLVAGGDGPAEGWVAESLEVARPAAYLRLSASSPLPAAIVTICADRTRVVVEPLCDDSNRFVARIRQRADVRWLSVEWQTPGAVEPILWTAEGGRLLGRTLEGRVVDSAPPSLVGEHAGGEGTP